MFQVSVSWTCSVVCSLYMVGSSVKLFVFLLFTDTQVVAYIFWLATVHHHPTGFAHHSTAATSQNSPCCTTRFLLLHHHWLAELSTWSSELLAKIGVHHWEVDRIQATCRWHGLGKQERVDDWWQFIALSAVTRDHLTLFSYCQISDFRCIPGVVLPLFDYSRTTFAKREMLQTQNFSFSVWLLLIHSVGSGLLFYRWHLWIRHFFVGSMCALSSKWWQLFCACWVKWRFVQNPL